MGQKLGQHFLIDKSVLGKIIKAAELSSDDTVLEIGPGKGMLTKQLLEDVERVVAVEKDGELHHKLKKKFKGADNLDLVHADIRDFNLTPLPKNYKLVANIPYYLTGQLIRMFLTSQNPPSVAVLMIQKEVADRLTAEKGNSSLLQLTTLVFAEVEKIISVSRKSFSPPPDVDSAIVKFKRREKPLLKKEEVDSFFRLLKFAFAGKRKKLTNTLVPALNINKQEFVKILKECALSENSRPQELNIDDWICLFRGLKL